ncbi:MAG: hypothetical protein ABL921_11065 [Pirellula sp.]
MSSTNPFVQFMHTVNLHRTSHIVLVLMFAINAITCLPTFAQNLDYLGKSSIADKDVPDYITHFLHRKDLFTPQGIKEIESLFAVKLESIQRRIMMSEEFVGKLDKITQSRVQEAVAARERAAERLKEAESVASRATNSDGKATVETVAFPTTRAMADQLLSVALLEQQRLAWDIAAEQALIQPPAEKSERLSDAARAEIQIAELSVKEALANQKVIEQEFAQAKALVQKGIVSERDLVKMTGQLQVASLQLEKARAKHEMTEAQVIATQKQPVADLKEGLAKLIARKKSVDESIQRIRKILPALDGFENEMRRILQIESSAQSISQRLEEVSYRLIELKALAQLIANAN